MSTPLPVFIVIEGLDGAGTTTQTQRLTEWFLAKGQPCVATMEPTDRAVGRLIRRTLNADPSAPSTKVLPWLFAADRCDHLEHLIEPSLKDGSVVLSDRYYHSSLAYQSLVLPLEKVHQLNASFRVPDTTYFIDVSVNTALQRLESRGAAPEVFETRERLIAIEQAYRTVIAYLKEKGQRIVRIDGEATPDEVSESIHEDLRSWWA